MRDDILLVEDRPDLVRDKHSKGIKNVNIDALTAYRKKRAQRMEMKNISDRMNQLEKKMDKIMEKLDRLLDD